MADIEKLNTVINELEGSSKKILKLADLIDDSKKLQEQAEKQFVILDELTKMISEANNKNSLSAALCEKACKMLDDYCTKSNEASFTKNCIIKNLMIKSGFLSNLLTIPIPFNER